MLLYKFMACRIKSVPARRGSDLSVNFGADAAAFILASISALSVSDGVRSLISPSMISKALLNASSLLQFSASRMFSGYPLSISFWRLFNLNSRCKSSCSLLVISSDDFALSFASLHDTVYIILREGLFPCSLICGRVYVLV